MLVGTLRFINFPSFYTVEHEGSLDVHKILSMDDLLGQMNSVHTVSSYFSEIIFSIILHCTMDCQVVTSPYLLKLGMLFSFFTLCYMFRHLTLLYLTCVCLTKNTSYGVSYFVTLSNRPLLPAQILNCCIFTGICSQNRHIMLSSVISK